MKNSKDQSNKNNKKTSDNERIFTSVSDKRLNRNLINKIEKDGYKNLNKFKRITIYSLSFLMLFNLTLYFRHKKNNVMF